jgi:uncharacterized membrane-anchored protein
MNTIDCGAGISGVTSIINFFTCALINSVIPMLVALAVAGFVYGIIQFYLNPDNEEKRKAGKSFMFMGLVTLFVMVSIWGIVAILSNTFLPGTGSKNPVLPGLPEGQVKLK